MKNYRLLSLLFFLFGFSLSLPAQTDYIFRHLDVNLGFPENQILSVFYLPDGRLGIRTTEESAITMFILRIRFITGIIRELAASVLMATDLSG